MRYYIAPLALVLSSALTATVHAETQLFISTSTNQDAQVQLNYPTAVRIEKIVQDGFSNSQHIIKPRIKRLFLFIG